MSCTDEIFGRDSVRLIRPGNMAQAIASHLPTLQKFASEVVTGESP